MLAISLVSWASAYAASQNTYVPIPISPIDIVPRVTTN